MVKEKRATVYICEALVLLSYLSLISYTVFELFSQISLYIFFAATILVFFINNKVVGNIFIYIIALLLYLLLSVIITDGGFGSILTFIVPIVLLFQFERIKFDKRGRDFIKIVSLVVFFLVFLESFVYAKDWIYHRFNDINPNTMSMFLLFAYMYYISLMKVAKYSWLKLFGLTCIAVLALYNYDSRTAIIVLLFFFVMNLFIKRFSCKAIYGLAMILLVVGILFPIVYLTLYRNGVSLEILGKSLYTGREKIWSNMFDMFNQNKLSWIWGLGSKVSLWDDRVLNVHNNYYAIIVDFGIIGFLAFYIMIFKKFKTVKSNDIMIKKLLLTFVGSTFLLGLTEITTMWSTTCVLAFLSFGIALSDQHFKGRS